MLVSDVQNQRIIYACLNWGKGHVARSIGLIQELISLNNEVLLAGDKVQLAIFKNYFPNQKCVEIESYPFDFKGEGFFLKDLFRTRKSIQKRILDEHAELEVIVTQYEISLVISDHRYGFYSKQCTSVFVTHQVQLALNMWLKPAQFFHNKYMKSFSRIWVMDDESSSLAGKLSKSRGRKNVDYIGFYSRFMNNKIIRPVGKLDVVICNGPQPYDEHLFLKYKNDLQKIIICPEYLVEKYKRKNTVSSKNWTSCDEVIMRATRIYAFCGYSTLMDLKFLTCDYKLFPTKGQTEQQYLFKRLMGKSELV